MKSVNLAHTDGRTLASADTLANSMGVWLCDLRRYREQATDPKDMALACVELEDLLQVGLVALDEMKRQILELSA